MLEGLSSNVYCIRQDTIFTAGDGVLCGSVRALVLQVAERCGLTVTERPLGLSDLPSIQEMFITSTSRLVLPLDTLELPDGRVVEFRVHDKASQLGAEVEASMQSDSVDVRPFLHPEQD